MGFYKNTVPGGETTDAQGNAVVAICDRCGQSLSHPLVLNGKTYGADCFEVVTGLRADHVRNYTAVDGTVNLEKRTADIAAAQVESARIKSEREQRVASVATTNAWLIDALMPYTQFCRNEPMNFFASIVVSLRDNGELATELPTRALRIIADVLAKEAGRSGSKKYDARWVEIATKLGIYEE